MAKYICCKERNDKDKSKNIDTNRDELLKSFCSFRTDLDNLLATSNVYNLDLSISNASTLDAADALGSNINIVNGSVTIVQTATMDATKLARVIDKIFTVTGNFSYRADATSVTPMTFDNLASTGDLTLTVNGPISASSLVTAGTVDLKTTFSSKVTSINMDLLTTVTDIQTQTSSHTVNFSSATDVQLGSLAIYPDPLSITTKKGATLDIGSLDDLNAAGTAVDMGLTVSGPEDVTISGWDDSYLGTITATNVENLTITGYEGAIVIGNGTENVEITGAVDVSLSGTADDLVSVDITTKLYDDPNVSSTNLNKAKVSYGGNTQVNSLSFSSANLTSITLGGYWDNITSTNNSNVNRIDIDATIGTLTVDNNDNLTFFDVTGSEINNVVFQNNSTIETVVFDHTTELNYVGATLDDENVTVSIVDNEGMTRLEWGANYVQSLTVTGNDKLASVDFSGLTAASTDVDDVTIALNVRDNDITAATATDIVDGLDTQYAIDGSTTAGVNNDALDLGTYGGDGGMNTLKPYLELAVADALATGNVHFDTVTTHSIDTSAILSSGETAGAQNSGNAATFEGTTGNGGAGSSESQNWVGMLWYNLPSTFRSVNPTAVSAQDQKRAFVLDISDFTSTASTVSLNIDGAEIFTTGNAIFEPIAVENTTNMSFLIQKLAHPDAVTRASNLGATLTVYKGANSTMPKIEFLTGSSSTSNGERYTNAEIAALYGGLGTINSAVTTYDTFSWTVGNNSVTVSLSTTNGTWVAGQTSGQNAADLVANTIAFEWNSKYGATAGVSEALSFWSDASTATAGDTIDGLIQISEGAGSRPYGQTMSFLHTKATAAQASAATSGALTFTFIDYIIGADDATLATTDNAAESDDLIVALEETQENAIAGNVTLTAGAGTIIDQTELSTLKLVASSSTSNTTAINIFDTDAGIYGSLSGGGEGDVRTDEAAAEGVDIETGLRRSYFSRIHWLVVTG